MFKCAAVLHRVLWYDTSLIISLSVWTAGRRKHAQRYSGVANGISTPFSEGRREGRVGEM